MGCPGHRVRPALAPAGSVSLRLVLGTELVSTSLKSVLDHNTGCDTFFLVQLLFYSTYFLRRLHLRALSEISMAELATKAI